MSFIDYPGSPSAIQPAPHRDELPTPTLMAFGSKNLYDRMRAVNNVKILQSPNGMMSNLAREHDFPLNYCNHV